MPCRDPDMDSSCNVDHGLIREYAEKINILTDLLCLACKGYKKESLRIGVNLYFPPKVGAWWKKHQAIDAAEQKKAREARRVHELRERALSKLSREERTALGLKSQ